MDSLKRFFITAGRILNGGLHNFVRNAWLTTAATAIMVVTLSIALFAIAINVSLASTLDDITKDVTLSIYLFDGSSVQQKENLEMALSSDENVEAVNFRTKEEALRLFQERNETNRAILKGLSIIDNSLPASYEVVLADLTLYESVVETAEGKQFEKIVESTSADQNEERRKSIERIGSAQEFVTKASIMAGGIFGVLSILIIFNTIRMAIFTRSYEIEIMKLLGASPRYIRGPFLFEASLYGIIAGLLSYSIVYITLGAMGPKLESYINVEDTIKLYSDSAGLFLLCSIGAGILIGFFSAAFAMAKYLRIRKW